MAGRTSWMTIRAGKPGHLSLWPEEVPACTRGRRGPDTLALLGSPLVGVVLLLRRRGVDLPKARKVLGLHLGRLAVFAADGVVDFLAMDADLFRGIDPQTHLVAADIHHG